MKTQLWTKREVDRLLRMFEAGHPASEMASLLGRTEASVRHKLLNMGFSSRRIIEPAFEEEAPPDTRIEEALLREKANKELEVLESRREVRAVTSEYKADILEERVLSEFRKTLFDMPPEIRIPELILPGRSELSSDGVAVVVVSDAHVGQVVDPRELDQRSSYNPAIFVSRLHHLEHELANIFRRHPAKEIVLLFGGDIIHGRLGHSLEDDLTLPIATQVDLALHCFSQFLGRLSQMADSITVHGVAGNHGRWPGTKKPPTDRRWSNLDTILYSSLAALCTATWKNIHFDERVSARRLVDVKDFRILLLHGDQLRGGYCAGGGIQKEMQHWLMRSVQRGDHPPDLIVFGDKHVSANLPVGLGQALINGSMVGEDVFSQNFAPSPPSQTAFFVRPGVGLTEKHLIRLDQAKMKIDPLPYDLKPALRQLVLSFANQTNERN